jgi:hypothetical protein
MILIVLSMLAYGMYDTWPQCNSARECAGMVK